MSIQVFFVSGGHLVQQKKTIFKILVEGHSRNISMKVLAYKKICLKIFSIFCSGGHFVQLGGRIVAILVDGHPRNIYVK